MRILLIGREGQIGWELRRTLACLGEVIALDRHTAPLAIDLADPQTLRAAVAELKPGLIVNAAAYTAVDLAEQDESIAFQVNAVAPGVLAEAALALDAGLIHYSTDYVFPGDGREPYRESDATGPQGVYGRSKLQGEQAIAQVGCAHLIFRTAWVYGNRGQNFLLTMLRLMREREVVRVVDDQRGSPTWSRMIAETTALAVARACDGDRFVPADRAGIYHMTCGGEATWFEFAQAIRAEGVSRGRLPADCARLEPIPSSQYPVPAKRPAYSVLSNERLHSTFGVRLPHWQSALDLCLDESLQARPDR